MTKQQEPASTSNIEPYARALCENLLRRPGDDEASLAAAVDRYWHCVAAQIDAGLIDDDGRAVPHSQEQDIAAYQDWKARHQDYVPPPWSNKLLSA